MKFYHFSDRNAIPDLLGSELLPTPQAGNGEHSPRRRSSYIYRRLARYKIGNNQLKSLKSMLQELKLDLRDMLTGSRKPLWVQALESEAGIKLKRRADPSPGGWADDRMGETFTKNLWQLHNNYLSGTGALLGNKLQEAWRLRRENPERWKDEVSNCRLLKQQNWDAETWAMQRNVERKQELDRHLRATQNGGAG